MKLINRETGNNCYEIIKEYKGGALARFYQTVAFFFDSNLKQPYNAAADDAEIEKIVLEVEELNLGLINLRQSSKTLDEVLIKEQKNEIELSLDKKIFNANNNLTAVGGTAIDLLRNIPSVFVNPDGEIQIRGSNNILVLIDGRPSGITTSNRQSALELLPANTIEKVEIISNPSSKYQADGTAGIINLITKNLLSVGIKSSQITKRFSTGIFKVCNQ